MDSLYFLEIESPGADIPAEMFLSLPGDRRDRLLRYRRSIDRKLGACADILLRCLLCARLDCLPGELEIMTGPQGKPYLAGRPVEFSVSHTRSAVAVALSDAPVGVDVEQIRPIDTGIAEAIFSASEQAYCCDGPGDRLARFYEVWTKKEARLKRCGTGLTAGLKSCDVTRAEHGETFLTVRAGAYIVSICTGAPLQESDIVRINESDLWAMWHRFYSASNHVLIGER